MSRIFLSYRRSDNQDATGRIYDRLAAKFGKDNIFKDVDSIPLGVDFRKHLSEVVGQCQLFLAIVGARWLDIRDDRGKRRLDDPNDLVRIEIEAALARGIPVIPVRVGDAVMPDEADLPPSLSPLAFQQGISVRADPDFHHDMNRLIAALQTMLTVPAAEPRRAATPPPAALPPPAPADAPVTTGQLQHIGEMLARLVTGGVNQEVRNLGLVAREFFEWSRGLEVPYLCDVIDDPNVTDIDRYKAIKLLGLALRRPQSRPYMESALDTLLDHGVLVSSLQTASLEAIMGAAAVPEAKWERLFNALDLVGEAQLYSVVLSLGQVIPPAQRQMTGAKLVEMMETVSSGVPAICDVLKRIGYRAGVPALIAIMESSTPWKAAGIAEVLVSWRVIDAAPAIRQAIESARYGNDPNVAQLAKHLYALEGVVASGFLTELLRDAVPELQRHLIDYLSDVNDSVFVDVISDLAVSSLDDSVKAKARAFMQKRGSA